MCTPCMQVPTEESDPLELELQMVVSGPIRVRWERNRILCESPTCSLTRQPPLLSLLCSLSRPWALSVLWPNPLEWTSASIPSSAPFLGHRWTEAVHTCVPVCDSLRLTRGLWSTWKQCLAHLSLLSLQQCLTHGCWKHIWWLTDWMLYCWQADCFYFPEAHWSLFLTKLCSYHTFQLYDPLKETQLNEYP